MTGRCTVFVDDHAWRVACVGGAGTQVRAVDCAGDADLSTKGRAAARCIEAFGGAGPVVVALPSGWCLSALIGTEDLGRGARRQALAYLLEEQLPLSAEDAVADYAEHRGQAMGVCAELDRLSPIVAALEAHGIAVAHICPAALLAAAHYAEQSPDADALLISPALAPVDAPATADGLVVQADVIELSRKMPLRWWWLTDAPAIDEHLRDCREQSGEMGLKLITNVDGPDVADCEMISADPADADHAAASHAARIVSGDVAAWIDLRCDALASSGRYAAYQKQAGLFAAGVALLLVSILGVSYWRGTQYRQQARAYADQQADVYKQAFPDSARIPATGIRSRLVSEQRKLEGLGGQASVTGNAGDNNAETLRPVSALTHLHHVLSALPDNQPESMRYQVLDLSIQPNQIRIDGQAISSIVPEQLANALRQTGRYDVDPPSPRLLNDATWRYDFVARPKALTAPEQKP